jgi:hypothetical protein
LAAAVPNSSNAVAFRIALLAVSLLFAFAICEVAIRVMGASRPEWAFSRYMAELLLSRESDPIYRHSDDPALAYDLVPSARRAQLRINQRGFRGPEVAASPAAGTTRVAVIGDSELFGALLLEEETFPAQLQTALERRNGSAYEVLNFGVPGYTTLQELRMLTQRALPLQPSDVVLLYVFNDPIIESVVTLPGVSQADRSYLISFLKWFVRSYAPGFNPELATHHGKGRVDFYNELHEGESFEPVAKALQTMAREVTKAGARFWLVISPEVKYFDDFAEYPFHSVHERLHAMESDEITLIDPLAAFSAAGRTPLSFWVIATDNHKNGDAHRILADVAAAQMTESPREESRSTQ